VEKGIKVVREGTRKMKTESTRTVGKREGGKTKANENEMIGVRTRTSMKKRE
jgi:hypothetical protein